MQGDLRVAAGRWRRRRRGIRRRRRVLRQVLRPPYLRPCLGILGVIAAAAFEVMAVYTAMPTAVKDLGGLGAYAWAFTAVSLAAIVATVLGGDISDRRGPRLPLIGGLLVVVGGLLVCAFAPTMTVVVLGRILQGLGGGAAIVAVYVVVARSFPEALRPQVFSAMAGAWVLPALVGPFIAGAITQAWSWRAVFLVVIPMVVAAAWAVGPTLKRVDGPGAVPAADPSLAAVPTLAGEAPDPHGTAPGPSYVAADRRGRTRTAGLLVVGALLVQDGTRRADLIGMAEALIGLVVLALSLRALLPAGVLRLARGLPAGVAARGLLGGAFFGAEAFVPLMLDDQRGFSVTAAGLALTASALGWFTGSWWQGRRGMGPERDRLVALGAVLVGIGIVGMAWAVVAPLPMAVALVTWAIGGLGMGITIPSVNVTVLALSPRGEQGANSAALQVVDGVGVLVCTSTAGAVYAASTAPAGEQATTFITLLLAMAAVAGLAVVAARRLASGPQARIPDPEPAI